MRASAAQPADLTRAADFPRASDSLRAPGSTLKAPCTSLQGPNYVGPPPRRLPAASARSQSRVEALEQERRLGSPEALCISSITDSFCNDRTVSCAHRGVRLISLENSASFAMVPSLQLMALIQQLSTRRTCSATGLLALGYSKLMGSDLDSTLLP